jgi:uncharacterized protein (DUF58 family)
VTKAGWLFLVVCILLGLAAVRSQAPMMYVIFGAMLAAMQVSSMMSVGMLRRIEVRRKAPARVWQNQVAPIAYFLRNLRRRSSLAMSVRELPPKSGRPGLQLANGYCAHLAAMSVFRAGARLLAAQRGRFQFGPVRVSTQFPFGLVEARRKFFQDASLVVWPARGRLRKQLLHRGAVETSSAAPSRGAGGQDEFFGLREYRVDDNPRWIHWRRSAGKLTPVVREMARPLPEILFILLDTQRAELGAAGLRPAASAGSEARLLKQEVPDEQARRLEHVLRFAATFIDEALGRGYQVGLALSYRSGPVVFGASASASHRTVLLDALADVDVNASHGLAKTISALRPGQLHLAQVVAVTLDDARAGGADFRGLRNSCRHLQVFSQSQLDWVFEDAPPAPPEGSPCP